MPDPIELISFVFSCCALAMSNLPGRKPKQIDATKTNMCPCEHPASMHEKKDGPCHGRIDVAGFVSSLGVWKQDARQERCSCQSYDGPEILPRAFGD